MLKSLKLINFRNFDEKFISDFEMGNFIIGENGKGKTNILEALSKICNNSLLKLDLNDLVKIGKDYFFIEVKDDKENTFSFYYSKSDKKKNFLLNNKKITSKKFFEVMYPCVVFSPAVMNMLYLSPSLRRDFLDDTIISCSLEYVNLLKDYKKVLKTRNSLLKAINEKKAKESEIVFWDEKFALLSAKIYHFRFQFIEFLEKSIGNIKECFVGKIENIKLEYITKIDKQDIENSIKTYLQKNLERDIILQKTQIGPHIDDFEIRVDGINVTHYASRGEIKSIIIYLKLLEGLFIEKKTGKKPIMLIDDLLSELDDLHKNMLLKKIEYYQTFISSIYKIEFKIYRFVFKLHFL